MTTITSQEPMSYAKQIVNVLVKAGLPAEHRDGIVKVVINAADSAAKVTVLSLPISFSEDGNGLKTTELWVWL